MCICIAKIKGNKRIKYANLPLGEVQRKGVSARHKSDENLWSKELAQLKKQTKKQVIGRNAF